MVRFNGNPSKRDKVFDLTLMLSKFCKTYWGVALTIVTDRRGNASLALVRAGHKSAEIPSHYDETMDDPFKFINKSPVLPGSGELGLPLLVFSDLCEGEDALTFGSNNSRIVWTLIDILKSPVTRQIVISKEEAIEPEFILNSLLMILSGVEEGTAVGVVGGFDCFICIEKDDSGNNILAVREDESNEPLLFFDNGEISPFTCDVAMALLGSWGNASWLFSESTGGDLIPKTMAILDGLRKVLRETHLYFKAVAGIFSGRYPKSISLSFDGELEWPSGGGNELYMEFFSPDGRKIPNDSAKLFQYPGDSDDKVTVYQSWTNSNIGELNQKKFGIIQKFLFDRKVTLRLQKDFIDYNCIDEEPNGDINGFTAPIELVTFEGRVLARFRGKRLTPEVLDYYLHFMDIGMSGNYPLIDPNTMTNPYLDGIKVKSDNDRIKREATLLQARVAFALEKSSVNGYRVVSLRVNGFNVSDNVRVFYKCGAELTVFGSFEDQEVDAGGEIKVDGLDKLLGTGSSYKASCNFTIDRILSLNDGTQYKVNVSYEGNIKPPVQQQ